MAAFTIGHSILNLEAFFNLLKIHNIKFIADVRSVPFSNRNPQFNRSEIEHSLIKSGFNYIFLGDKLGGRPLDESLFHDNGLVNYLAVRCSKPFEDGLKKYISLASEGNAALMCGEEDPITCHRGLMIAPALAKIGMFSNHIRKGGAIETHRMFIQRTSVQAKILKIAQLPTLFPDDSEEKLFEEATEKLSRKYGFRKS